MNRGKRGSALKRYDELTDQERAERAGRRALGFLDRPLFRRTPDEVRLLSCGDGYWELVADLMQAEITAREARGRFRVVKPQLPRPRCRAPLRGTVVPDLTGPRQVAKFHHLAIPLIV